MEENQIDFVSQNKGQMHACGHDKTNMATLLGFAKYLTTIQPLEKSVLFNISTSEEAPSKAKENVNLDY